MSDRTVRAQASLRMREPAELVGAWQVTGVNSLCRISFLDERIDDANAWRVEDRERCLANVAPGVVGWRPAPDGVELVAADRRTVLMFAAGDGGTGVATLPDGRRLTLTRA